MSKIGLVFLFLFVGFAFSSFANRASYDVYRSYLLETYSDCVQKLKRFNMDNDRKMYLMGLSYLKLGEYQKARNCFRKIIKEFKDSKFYPIAYIRLGDAYFLEEDFKKAEIVYDLILKKQIASFYLPLLYLRKAQVCAKQGRWREERKFIGLIKKNYPQSIEKKYAQLLEDRGYFFTVQVGAFSHKKNALNLVKELKESYPVYIVEEVFDGLKLYKVRIGKFKERSLAEKIYSELIEKGYPAHIYP